MNVSTNIGHFQLKSNKRNNENKNNIQNIFHYFPQNLWSTTVSSLCPIGIEIVNLAIQIHCNQQFVPSELPRVFQIHQVRSWTDQWPQNRETYNSQSHTFQKSKTKWWLRHRTDF